MKAKFSKLVAATAVLCGFAATDAAVAQSYPSKPVSLIVPYGPGGNGDLAARALAFAVERQKLIDQPIVVENKDGAGGIVGTRYVQQSRNDGYTLLLARVGSQVVAPALDPVTPYKWDDLTPIGLLEVDPYVCVVKADSPFKSFRQLLDAVKSNPGKYSFATTSNMDASVVFPVKAFLNVGADAGAAIKVPYKGAGATVTAILSGTVDFTCNALAPFVGGLKAGTLRALVVSTADRVPEAPDAPTVGELGMKDLEMVSGWSALFGPPNLPKEIVDYWAAILRKTKTSPAWLDQVRKRGTLPSIMSPSETRKFAEEQFVAYRSLSRYIGADK